MHPKRMSEGANHICFMFLIQKSTQKPPTVFFFLSYGPNACLPQNSKITVFWDKFSVNHEPKTDVFFWLKSHCFKVLNPLHKTNSPSSHYFRSYGPLYAQNILEIVRMSKIVFDHKM